MVRDQTTAKPTLWWLEQRLTAVAARLVSALAVWGVVHWRREPRLTDEQRLEQLASLPPDMPLEALTGPLPWLRCSATRAPGSTRFDHQCVSKGSRLIIVAGTLDTRLASIIVHQIPAGPNLETWREDGTALRRARVCATSVGTTWCSSGQSGGPMQRRPSRSLGATSTVIFRCGNLCSAATDWVSRRAVKMTPGVLACGANAASIADETRPNGRP